VRSLFLPYNPCAPAVPALFSNSLRWPSSTAGYGSSVIVSPLTLFLPYPGPWRWYSVPKCVPVCSPGGSRQFQTSRYSAAHVSQHAPLWPSSLSIADAPTLVLLFVVFLLFDMPSYAQQCVIDNSAAGLGETSLTHAFFFLVGFLVHSEYFTTDVDDVDDAMRLRFEWSMIQEVDSPSSHASPHFSISSVFGAPC